MGFSLSFGKKAKMRKLIENYVNHRIKEKKAFNQQIERLHTQLHDKKIEQQTYERLKTIIETQYLQKQQEEWANVKNKFHNPLNA